MEKIKAKSFRDLIVWQKAHQFVLDVYLVSGNFQKVNYMVLFHSSEGRLFQFQQILQRDLNEEVMLIKRDL